MATKLSGAGAIATPAAVELARGYVEEFADARRAEGWRARDALETYYAFERVRNWAATGLRRQSAFTDLFSPYVSRDFVRYAFSPRTTLGSRPRLNDVWTLPQLIAFRGGLMFEAGSLPKRPLRRYCGVFAGIGDLEESPMRARCPYRNRGTSP